MSDDFDTGEDLEIGAVPRFSPALVRRLGGRRRVVQAGPAAGAPGVGVILPLGSTLVTTATSATLTATVEEAMALEDLVVDASYSEDWNGGRFVLSDIKVGTRSLLAGTEESPLGLFASTAQKRPQVGRGIVVRPGKSVTVTMTLVGSAATVGSCGIVGGFIGSAR